METIHGIFINICMIRDPFCLKGKYSSFKTNDLRIKVGIVQIGLLDSPVLITCMSPQ